MGWWFGSRNRARPEAPVEPEPPEPTVRHSPGLCEVLGRIRGRRPCRVLDLASASHANISFLSAFAHHIRIVDLLGEEPAEPSRAASGDDLMGRSVGRLAPRGWGTFDLVLAWDVLNYLDEPRARMAVERLAAATVPGSWLLVLVVNVDEMSERPLAYRILDEQTLECRTVCGGLRPSPRWSSSVVEKLLRGWKIERSFVLRHGVQEYVAVRG